MDLKYLGVSKVVPVSLQSKKFKDTDKDESRLYQISYEKSFDLFWMSN